VTVRPMSSLQRLSSRIRLGFGDWREVERVGLDELAKGHSEAEVVRLSSVTDSSSDLVDLVDAAVRARGDEVPDAVAAAELVARDVAQEIVDLSVAPIAGARTLWQLARKVPTVEPDLRIFIGLASEWDDDAPSRRAYEADIVSAARELIASAGQHEE
jgi:hypothetical protein